MNIWLILDVKTCEPLECMTKENNSYKTKKNFTSFFTEDDPNIC